MPNLPKNRRSRLAFYFGLSFCIGDGIIKKYPGGENIAYEQPDDFRWDIITGFRKLAEPSGCWVDVVPLTLEFQKRAGYDTYMFRSGYQGALFLGVSFYDPWTRNFRTCTTPTVLYDHPSNANPAVTQVGIR